MAALAPGPKSKQAPSNLEIPFPEARSTWRVFATDLRVQPDRFAVRLSGGRAVTFLAPSGPAEPIACENPVGTVTQPGETGPSGWRQQPTEPNRRIGAPEDLEAFDRVAVRKLSVDLIDHVTVAESEISGIEVLRSNVDERDPVTAIAPFEKTDLTRAERTRAVVEELEIPGLGHFSPSILFE